MGSSNSCNINESKSKSGGSLKESQCSNCNNNMTSNIQDNSNRSSNYGQPGYGLPSQNQAAKHPSVQLPTPTTAIDKSKFWSQIESQ
ncbi:GM14689 [Drosophila sechellia]|uniref:GM14689 n=2 Tax=melanogaster subgroup TaxID=32351 RepID=B4HUC4_DROSE|nr:GM14689 [Drosophila sechellia]